MARITVRVKNPTDFDVDRGGVVFPAGFDGEVTVPTPFRVSEIVKSSALEAEVLTDEPEEPPVLTGEDLTAAEGDLTAAEGAAEQARAAEANKADELAAAVENLDFQGAVLDEERREAALAGEDVGAITSEAVDAARRRVAAVEVEMWGARVRRADAELSALEASVPVVRAREAQRRAAIAAAEQAVEAARADLARVRRENDHGEDEWAVRKRAAAVRERLHGLHEQAPGSRLA